MIIACCNGTDRKKKERWDIVAVGWGGIGQFFFSER